MPSLLSQSHQNQQNYPSSSTVHELAPTAAYVHVPFCRRRCFYCDFAISVVGDRPPLSRRQVQSSNQPGDQANTGFGTIAEYIDVLSEEIQATTSAGPPLQTIFLGGGTPSLLTVSQLDQILTQLDQQFGIATGAEISMEIDPDTFDQDRLQSYRAAGINRVSLGVQAFQPELLAACGRTHTRADVDAAIEMIQAVGLTNYSVDLISGLPHQTLADWQASLQATIGLTPTHISVYDLTVEAGTAFDRWYQAGVEPLPTEEMTAEMYRLAQQTLTAAGYQHYEISNYAQPGYQCRHNRVYWENRSYYGFGMAAASYRDGQRFTRPRKRRDYYKWVQEFKATSRINCPNTSTTEALLDTLMLGLRLAEGISLILLRERFGEVAIQQILRCLQTYQQSGWIGVDEASQRIWLTDPDGFLFSNVVLAELFKVLSAED